MAMKPKSKGAKGASANKKSNLATKKPAKPVLAANIKDAFTKNQIHSYLAEAAELTKKQVAAIFDELSVLMERHIKKNSVGEFTVPGLFKVRVVHKPATKARKGINPFTGQEQLFKAKPARNVVKVKPLKALKDMVA